MAITKEKKESIVSKLVGVTKEATGVVFVTFTGLPVILTTEMRKALRDQGVGYFVAKKTLIRRAFGASAITGDLPELPGEIGVVYGADPLVTAKSIYEFQKTNAKKITIIGGVYEGAYASGDYMTALAKVPSREVLYGQFVNMINWPIQSFVMTLSQVASKKEEQN
jgi:large subunit ribosomal protein L10